MIELDCPECGEIDSLRIRVEFEPESDGYIANIEEQACECKLKLRLAKTLIESSNEVSTNFVGGILVYAEGINALTGAVTKRIDR